LQSAIFAIFFGLQNISVFYFVQLPISILFAQLLGSIIKNRTPIFIQN